MKTIHYDGRDLRTTDAVADAVIEYAAVLGANTKTDTVVVPVLDDAGRPTEETLLLGPASQITLSGAAAHDGDAPLGGDEVVERLRRLGRAAGPARPVHEDPDAHPSPVSDFD